MTFEQRMQLMLGDRDVYIAKLETDLERALAEIKKLKDAAAEKPDVKEPAADTSE